MQATVCKGGSIQHTDLSNAPAGVNTLCYFAEDSSSPHSASQSAEECCHHPCPPPLHPLHAQPPPRNAPHPYPSLAARLICWVSGQPAPSAVCKTDTDHGKNDQNRVSVIADDFDAICMKEKHRRAASCGCSEQNTMT